MGLGRLSKSAEVGEPLTMTESKMSDLAQTSGPSGTHRGSHDLALVSLLCILALAVCFVAAIYSDPANIAPSDPVAGAFYP